MQARWCHYQPLTKHVASVPASNPGQVSSCPDLKGNGTVSNSRLLRLSIAGVAALGIGVCGSPLPSALATPMSVPAPLAPGQSSPEQQSMGLTGAPNARDIGGYPTQQGGGKIRYGLVFRSDNLAKLTDADQQKLLTLKIGSVLDFRSPNEVKDSPDKLPPAIPATKLPVWDPNND